jgi:hypothetical protein
MPERIRISIAGATPRSAPGLRLPAVRRRFPVAGLLPSVKLRFAVRLRLVAAVQIAAWFFTGCGDIRIAGGASEIGNPAKAVLDDGSGQDAPSEVTGFGISARGLPVRVIRESRSASEDTTVAGTLPDSSHAGILPDDSLAPAGILSDDSLTTDPEGSPAPGPIQNATP